MPELDDETALELRCPSCGTPTASRDGDEFRCPDCGAQFTHDEYLESVAERVRAKGFDNLADRLDAVAKQVEEVGT